LQRRDCNLKNKEISLAKSKESPVSKEW
jgi:hypothetical protein